MAKLYIGLSGYSYPEWQGEGLLYPPTLKKSHFLNYYVSRYSALESDGTFRRMPSDSAVAKWNKEFPEGFCYSPKMHQSVTHFKRLKPESYDIVSEFVKPLELLEKSGKLGPILIQLPPNFKRNDDLLAEFLANIPHRETIRWAIEFRNTSWHSDEVEVILAKHNVAWAAVETDDEQAQLRHSSPEFSYVRLRQLTYSDEQLKKWAEYFRGLIGERKDCFVFCRHKDTVAPWTWADRILELLER